MTATINRHKAVILAHMAATGLGIGVDALRCDSIPAEAIRQLRGEVERAENFAIMRPPWALHSRCVPVLDLAAMDALGVDPSASAAISPQLPIISVSAQTAGEPFIAVPAPKAGEKSSTSSSSSSSYSESCTSSDEEKDLEGMELPIPFRAWEKGEIHLQHFKDSTGLVLYCREKPFPDFIHEAEQILEENGQWAMACKKRRAKIIPASMALAVRSRCDKSSPKEGRSLEERESIKAD